MGPLNLLLSSSERPLTPRSSHDADRPPSARLRHAKPPERAKPKVRLCAHYGHSAAFGGFSEADIGLSPT